MKFDYYDTGTEAVNSLRPWNIIDLNSTCSRDSQCLSVILSQEAVM